MNDAGLIFLLFVIALSGAVIGIFIGFGMGQQHILKQLDTDRREGVKSRAFARLDRARADSEESGFVDLIESDDILEARYLK